MRRNVILGVQHWSNSGGATIFMLVKLEESCLFWYPFTSVYRVAEFLLVSEILGDLWNTSKSITSNISITTVLVSVLYFFPLYIVTFKLFWGSIFILNFDMPKIWKRRVVRRMSVASAVADGRINIREYLNIKLRPITTIWWRHLWSL